MSAQNDKLQFMLPPGRLVMGDLVRKNPKDYDGNLLPENEQMLFFAVAVPKTDPNINAIIGQIMNYAWGKYQSTPQVQSMISLVSQSGFDANGAFAFKISDGDNIKNKDKAGCAGCWIFKYTTLYAPMKCCNAQNVHIDPAHIKLGYWVDVGSSIGANGKTDRTAGIFMNPVAVRLLGYGEEIITGPSFDTIFGGKHGTLPPGALAAPVQTAIAGFPASPPAQPAFGQPGFIAPPTPSVAGYPAPLSHAPASGHVAQGHAPASGFAPLAGNQTAFPSNPPAAFEGLTQHHGFLTPQQ